jgi:hypothetical protein
MKEQGGPEWAVPAEVDHVIETCVRPEAACPLVVPELASSSVPIVAAEEATTIVQVPKELVYL